MQKFTIDDREAVRQFVLQLTKNDTRCSGGAVVGSGATESEDEWSDLDLSFGIRSESRPKVVLEEWTATLEPVIGKMIEN